MGTKTPLKKPVQAEQPQDDIEGPAAAPTQSARSRCISSIADALGVPVSTLYNPPNAIMPARAADRVDAPDACFDRECDALLHAYKRISDPERRGRLLALAQEVAEQA